MYIYIICCSDFIIESLSIYKLNLHPLSLCYAIYQMIISCCNNFDIKKLKLIQYKIHICIFNYTLSYKNNNKKNVLQKQHKKYALVLEFLIFNEQNF